VADNKNKKGASMADINELREELLEEAMEYKRNLQKCFLNIN
jgi:hypothetical protein